MQHGALEAELGHRALEFVGRRLRIGGGERGEGGEPLAIGLAELGEAVIDPARDIGRDVGRQLLGRGRAVRQHLDVDAGLVHLLDAERAEIIEPLVGLVAAAGFRTGKMLGELGVPIMLFDGDDRTIRLFEHDVYPATILKVIS